MTVIAIAGEKVAEVSPRSRDHRIKFRRTSTNDIMAATFAPIKWVVPGYISEGFLVLAGRQKLGKTWLAIDMALAVATGGVAMGSIPCELGDVLYIDMENGPRRIQGRINTLYPDERTRPDLSRLEWVTEAPQLDAGFVDELEHWRMSVPAPRLVVVDVLQRIKPPGSMARNAYENDYSAWARSNIGPRITASRCLDCITPRRAAQTIRWNRSAALTGCLPVPTPRWSSTATRTARPCM